MQCMSLTLATTQKYWKLRTVLVDVELVHTDFLVNLLLKLYTADF